MTGVSGRCTAAYTAILMALVVSPGAAQTQSTWEYLGVLRAVPGERFILGTPFVRAIVRGSDRAYLSVECRSPDGFLPAQVTFSLGTNLQYDEETHEAEDVAIAIRASEGDYSLVGLAKKTFLSSELEVLTEWQFGDSSMAAVRAIRAASGPVEVVVFGTRIVFPSEGAAAAIDQMLVGCGVQESPIQQAGATDHLQCVAHYWTLGALRPDLQSETTPRVRHAAQAYARETPTATEAGIREDVLPRVQARGQAIQAGEEDPAALIADAQACDARYGHEPLNP